MKKICLWFLGILLVSGFATSQPLKFEKSYELFSGGQVSLNEQLGKHPIYLKFWATWCLDCRKELPSLQKTYEKYHDKMAMYAVNLNINESAEDITSLKQKAQLTMPILMDNNGSIASNFNFKGTPFHVLIDQHGKVVYTTYKDDAQLNEQLDKLAAGDELASAEMPEKTQNKTQAPQSESSLIYFSATWCDWYMADIHPDMSKNCISATKIINHLAENTKMPLKAYVTHLWTTEEDITEYKKKFSIQYPVKLDDNNQDARRYKVSQYPTLILIKDGKEIKRFTEFDDSEMITKTVSDVFNQTSD